MVSLPSDELVNLDDSDFDEDPSADELYRAMQYDGEVKTGCQFHRDAMNQHCEYCRAIYSL